MGEKSVHVLSGLEGMAARNKQQKHGNKAIPTFLNIAVTDTRVQAEDQVRLQLQQASSRLAAGSFVIVRAQGVQ